MTTDDSALAGLAFSLVGPGRVGSSLAHWACARGARLVSVSGGHSDAAHGLARALGATRIELADLSTEGQELLLLALPDASYGAVARELATRPQARVALHTSGSLDVSVLDPLREAGGATGSLHPLKAFSRPLLDVEEAAAVFFALDGSAEAIRLGEQLVTAWKGHCGVVQSSQRLLYHFAATLAAGGVATLMTSVWRLMGRLGLPAAVWPGYVQLAHGALEETEAAAAPAQAITGPAARGDTALIERELEALETIDPELADLTRRLWQETRRQIDLDHETPLRSRATDDR